MLNEAREFGICRGLTVPIHGLDGESGYFSVSLDDRTEPFDEIVGQSSAQVALIGQIAHNLVIEKFVLARNQPEISLTARERECLLWVGEGKTAWETANIIGCSKATVQFHLLNASKKLEVTGKFSAYLKACRQGLLR